MTITIYPLFIVLFVMACFAARDVAYRYGWGVGALLGGIFISCTPMGGLSLTFTF